MMLAEQFIISLLRPPLTCKLAWRCSNPLCNQMLTHLRHHFNRAKKFLGDGYGHVAKWAGDVDRLAGIGRRAFSAISPILDDFGVSTTQGVRAIKNYDQLRHGVMEADHYARGHAARIEGLL